MNIFFVDRSPVVAATMLCDKHVVKMVLETAQILSTVCGGPYKPTHQKHPSVLWASGQVKWVHEHFVALLSEYTHRYGRVHKCAEAVPQLTLAYQRMHLNDWSDPPQCMPEQYRCSDTVEAYRRYYVGDKSRFAQWNRGREAPAWYQESLTLKQQ